MTHKFLVVGVGKYGSNIARQLAEKGVEVVCFDANEDKIENIKDDVAFAVTLDATDKKALRSQEITDVTAAIVAIGDNFEAVILCSSHLMDLGVKRLIARASGPQQKLILEKIGVEEILTPEEEVANILSERLLNPSVMNFLSLPDDYEIVEIKPPRKVIGRSIEEVNFRDNYKLTLITIEREFCVTKNGEDCMETHTLGVTASNTKIETSDKLLMFGRTADVERFLEINE